MKLKLLIIALTVFHTINTVSQNNWRLDKSHSNVLFTVDHLIVSEVTGAFESYNVTLNMTGDDLTTAKISGDIDASSINTNDRNRDNRLRTQEFFYVEKHPKITFNSKSIKKLEDYHYLMVGDLTIRGITKEVELKVTYKGTAEYFGQTKTGIKIMGEINRMDFGLSVGPLLETGGMVIGKMVKLSLNFEMQK